MSLSGPPHGAVVWSALYENAESLETEHEPGYWASKLSVASLNADGGAPLLELLECAAIATVR